METQADRKNVFTVTGVFASSRDAENAYHLLIELGYMPEEITLIMSEEMGQRISNSQSEKSGLITEKKSKNIDRKFASGISHAVDSLGKFVALPGVSLMVAGDFNDGGVRALTNSVMSDKYADFYRSLILEGEIVIDFTPHTAKEKNMITGLWENYRGYPIIRRASNAA